MPLEGTIISKTKEITRDSREKLAEIKTTDFSHKNIHALLCQKFGELFISLDEIEHAIMHNVIEICEDGFILYRDVH